MAGNSLTDIAFNYLKEHKKEVIFNDLWKVVCDEMGYSETLSKRKIAPFYNALMLDARFISLEQNHWDLRDRHSDDALKIDPDLLDDDDYDDDLDYDSLLDD